MKITELQCAGCGTHFQSFIEETLYCTIDCEQNHSLFKEVSIKPSAANLNDMRDL